MTATNLPELSMLRRAAAELHTPGTDGYESLRLPWNLAVDQRPAAVAVPRTAAEVAAVVRAAAAAGLRVAPQSTGHGAGPMDGRDLSDVVLLRLSHLVGVTVDPARRTAHILGGTSWRAVIDAAAPHGLTAAHGSSADVGVAGYLLSGGVSFYGRRHGLAVNHLRSAEVVTADGTLRRASAEENPDLFWAIRGGAANLGIVAGMEIDLLPYADVFAGMLLWHRDRAPDVIRAWLSWTSTVPESVTTSLRVMSFPAAPELPPFLAGRDIVVIDGAILETDERAGELLAPLRNLSPEIDTFARIPTAELPAVHMDPPVPTPMVSEHSILADLDDRAVDAMMDVVGPGTDSGLAFAELRHLGGALARPDARGGALSDIPGEYAMYCAAVAPHPLAVINGRVAARALERALAPWSWVGLLPTFTDNQVDGSRFFDGEIWADLCRLRDRFGGEVFEANHRLGARTDEKA